MESKATKKRLLIILAILLVIVIVAILILLLFRKNKDEYITTPIHQTSISTSTKKVLFEKVNNIQKEDEYYLWEIKNSLQLEKLKKLANDNGLELIYSREGITYQWEKNQKQIIYNLVNNTVTIIGENIISSDDLSSISSSTFSDIAKRYFDLDWRYEVFQTEKRDAGETVYYAKRILDNKNLIEMGGHNHQTDYLAVKNNRIVHAKLLLADFINTGKRVPLISQKELDIYANQKNYPKDFYPQTDILNNDPVFEEIEYVEEEYKKLLDSINNCQTENIKIVYLYKNMAQEYLTPVYALDSQCQAQYKDKQYFIPAVIYLNAIDPNLIIAEEK